MIKFKEITNTELIPAIINALQEYLPRTISPTAVVQIEHNADSDDYTAHVIDRDALQRLICYPNGQIEIVTWERPIVMA